MEVIKIPGTEDTPNVFLDAKNGVFEFSGRSLPEDVLSFYAPVLQRIEEYIQTPNPRSEVIFRLDYFNTASSKIILDILIYFEHISKEGHEVLVKWFYHTDDEDMAEAGEEYFEIVDIPYEMHSY
jgi:hypothetical protein